MSARVELTAMFAPFFSGTVLEEAVSEAYAVLMNEAADAVALDRDSTIPSGGKGAYRRGMTRAEELLRRMADAAEQGEKDTREGEPTPQPAELTIYRASHESIVMGHYTTRQAAMDHVHGALAKEEGGDVTPRVIWRADNPEADEPTWECWLFDTDMSDDSPTGYVVTPLTVASAYDEEADE